MAYRGRLIHKRFVDMARLDTTATRAGGGYNDSFKTVVKVKDPTTGRLVAKREEIPELMLPCQIEAGPWEQMRAVQGGNLPDTAITLVFFWPDLEKRNLVDPATGEALIRINDRLVAIYDARKVLLHKPRQELFATHAQPLFVGLGGTRNLLVVTLGERPQGNP